MTTTLAEMKEISKDEKVDSSETVRLKLEYKGKTYSVDRKFTDKVIELNGYPQTHYNSVKDGVVKLMRAALLNEGKINQGEKK